VVSLHSRQPIVGAAAGGAAAGDRAVADDRLASDVSAETIGLAACGVSGGEVVADDHLVAAAAVESCVAPGLADRVAVGLVVVADDQVGAATAVDPIIAGATDEDVAPHSALDRVVAGAATDDVARVVALRDRDLVVTRATRDDDGMRLGDDVGLAADLARLHTGASRARAGSPGSRVRGSHRHDERGEHAGRQKPSPGDENRASGAHT